MPGQRVQFQSGGIPLIVIQVLLPIVLSIIAGYGAVRYTSGATQQELQELNRRSLANKAEIDQLRANSVTREEMRLFIESAREDLTEIKADIRAIRYGEPKR